MLSNDAKPKTFEIDQDTVNRLVREVIRRLHELKTGEVIKLSEKVITASTIERIPKTQKTLTIAAGAIITPAARDEVKRRNISIGRDTDNATQTPRYRAAETKPRISDSAKPERAASITAQLQRRGVKLPKTNILLSETPGHDVYEQITRHGQRSVMIASLADVDRFHTEMSPTSWVLDMTRLNFVAATNVAARIAQLEI
jgi:hypothetical protein